MHFKMHFWLLIGMMHFNSVNELYVLFDPESELLQITEDYLKK